LRVRARVRVRIRVGARVRVGVRVGVRGEGEGDLRETKIIIIRPLITASAKWNPCQQITLTSATKRYSDPILVQSKVITRETNTLTKNKSAIT